MPRKRKEPRMNDGLVGCPICGAGTIIAEVPSGVATMLSILPGKKYVCAGKFIYRSRPDNVQFQKCYGMPVEAAVRMKQLSEKDGKRSFSDQEITDAMTNVATQNFGYAKAVMESDPFFKNVMAFVKPTKISLVEEILEEDDDDAEIAD